MSEQVRKLPQQEVVQGEASAQELPVKDIRSLMTEIRDRVKADVEGNRDKHRELSRTIPRLAHSRDFRRGDLHLSEDLRYLNLNYAYDSQLIPAVIPSHRPGPLGKVVPLFKRLGRKVLRKFFLADYFNAQRDFSGNLVRHLNTISQYIDDRDDALIAKIDRIDDEQSSAILALRQEIEALEHNRIRVLDEMIRGLEGIVNNLPRYTAPNPPQAVQSSEQLPTPDPSYLLLENRYRGGEAEIERRLSIYPEIFKSAQGTVLEIGSGRGELQRLFKKSGVQSYGVDLDTVMVNVANAAGCDTKFGDGIAHLRSLVDASLGGLVAIQLVEHLTRSQLSELFELAKRKLKPGSRIVFETINPQSLLALSSNYFRDPTHVWPQHPDTLGYTATLAGLKIVETRYLSPVSPNHMLREIPEDSNQPPPVLEATRRINQNIEQLNRLLYGFQDYALVLEVV